MWETYLWFQIAIGACSRLSVSWSPARVFPAIFPSDREPGTGSMNKEAILNRTSDHMIKNMKFTYDLLDDWC